MRFLLVLGAERPARILGLIAALAISSLIVGICLASIYFELRTDSWHPGSATSYRLVVNYKHLTRPQPSQPNTPLEFADRIRSEIATIGHVTGTVSRQLSLSLGDGGSTLLETLYADSAFPEMFAFGVDRKAIEEARRQRGVFLSRAVARRWLGARASVGTRVKLGRDEFTIMGLIDEPPADSHLRVDAILPIEFVEMPPPGISTAGMAMTYVNLPNPIDPLTLGRLAKLYSEMVGAKWAVIQVQRLPEIAFSTPLPTDRIRAGGGRDLFVAGALAIIVLAGVIGATSVLLAAMISRQRHTLGVLNALGSTRGAIWRRAMAEVLLLAGVALVPALLVALFLSQPLLIALDKRIALLPFAIATGSAVAGTLVVTAAAASLAVWRAVGGSTIAIIRGDDGGARGYSAVALAPLAVQVALGFAVLLFCVAISQSIGDYLRASSMFADVWRTTAASDEDAAAIVARLQRSPIVRSAELSGWVPFLPAYTRYVAYPGAKAAKRDVEVSFLASTANAERTLGAVLLAGRWLNAGDEWTRNCNLVAGEQAVRRIFAGTGLADARNAIGKSTTIASPRGEVSCRIVGVVSDLRIEHANMRTPAPVYAVDTGFRHFIIIRTQSGVSASELRAAAGPGLSTSMRLPLRLGDVVRAAYANEARARTAFLAASAILLGLACYMLLSATMLAVELRRIEIGVMRAFGAPWRQIGARVMTPFLIVFGLGLAAGYPIYLFIARSWQQNGQIALTIDPSGMLVAIVILLLPILSAAIVVWRLMTAIEPALILRSL